MVDMKRMMGGALHQAPLVSTGQPPDMGDFTPKAQQAKRGVGGFLSDFIINYGAASGNQFAGNILQNRVRSQQLEAQRQAQELLYERKRADRKADKAPYRWESNDGSLMEMGPKGPRVAYKDPTPKINYKKVPNPNGTFTMVPIPMGGIPQPRQITPQDWERGTPIGGGSSNAAGGFRTAP